jgi:hypothetical protein
VLPGSPPEEVSVQWARGASPRRHPYVAERGWLTGGLKVVAVRHGAQAYPTTRLTLPAAEVRRRSSLRAPIDEVIRVCQDQLGLSACQARSERAQQHHVPCGLVAFCGRERERDEQGLRISKLKRQRSFQGDALALPALARLRRAA